MSKKKIVRYGNSAATECCPPLPYLAGTLESHQKNMAREMAAMGAAIP